MDFLPKIMKSCASVAQQLWSGTRGSIAQITALAVPFCACLAIGSVELVSVSGAENRFQNIANAGALEGASQLGLSVSNGVIIERTASFVEAQFEGWSGAPDYQGSYEIIDRDGQRAVRVLLNGYRPSFLADLIPKGGWKFRGEATAASVGRAPLCILATGSDTDPPPPAPRRRPLGMLIEMSSRIEAPACGLHSNAFIRLDAAARMAGRRIQAVQGADGGTMTPAPGTGAAAITDPFASMTFPSTNSCPFYGNGQANPVNYGPHGTYFLPPGIHCRPIIVKNNATLVLEPGDHFFRKNLQLQGPARLTGEDVFLFFDHGSDPLLNGGNARVDLIGRKSGPYAGMVMATIAGNQPNITIPAGVVERLLGVVYVRNGFLQVIGSGVAAEGSAWTVIVAKQIITKGVARISINADYEGSDVPVPIGVGPNGGQAGGTRLID